MMTYDYTCRVAGHLHVICVTAVVCSVCAVCALLLLSVRTNSCTVCDSASVVAELPAAHLAPAPLPELPANRSPSPAVPAACSLLCCCCRAGPADVKLLLVLA